ncbi:recombinase family protein [Streptomyces sp. B8F3]|uniref:recombinase family protein n=1 Tax=Streptomyces sp. B8F3 TaxID=3153573 RepID=UPI00325C3EEC
MSEPTAGSAPPAYGYMRIFRDVPDRQIRAMEFRLRAFADDLGLHLLTVYQEVVSGSTAEFDELCGELERADVEDVIVLSLSHFSPHEVLQAAMVERLLLGVDASVHALTDHRPATCA